MATKPDAWVEGRRDPRDEVHVRTRATDATGRTVPLLVVNLSPRGLMARSDAALAPGDRLRVQFPVIGAVVAEVRWALGGRIGCELDGAIGAADYHALLAAVPRG